MSFLRKIIYPLLITVTFIILPGLSFDLYNKIYVYNRYNPILSSQFKKTLPPASKTVDIVARVGGYQINTLSGWASPFAEVSLSSQGVARKTIADENGFFVFYSIPLPDQPTELCLIAQDVNQLPTFPLCLPPPPRNQNIDIKDILLSPTLSLDNGKIIVGKTAKASGMTTPNSKIEVYLFVEKNLSFWARITKIFPTIRIPKIPIVQSVKFKVITKLIESKLLTVNCNFALCTLHFALVNPVYAANFPIYEIKSNENGYFEFSLPTFFLSNNRLFVSSVFSPKKEAQETLRENGRSYFSPKSNTLSFQVIGLWELLKKFLQTISARAKLLIPNWQDPLFIILIEILILFSLAIAVITKENKGSKKDAQNL